jgi:hypothetical protein
MALRFHFFNALRRLAAAITRRAERWSQRFEPSRALAASPAETAEITATTGADDDVIYELIPLANDAGEVQAGAFTYGIRESQEMIEFLRKEKIYGSGTTSCQSVSSAVGDFAAKLTPTLATAIQAGQVMRIVGPPSVVEGLAKGTMTLMQSGGNNLGGVLVNGSTKIAHQARFAPVAPIVAPLLVYQAVHAIVGTQQLNKINRRLARIEGTLSRMVQRQNAKDLGEVIAAASTLEKILGEHAHSGHFNAHMQDRMSHCERDLRAHLERLTILKEDFHKKIKQARTSAKRRGQALELAVIIKDEGDQFGQDMRLLIALSAAVIRLEQGFMLIDLEHHPDSLAHREKQLKDQIKRCNDTLSDMVDLSEVKTEIKVCLDSMNWWQRNIFHRSGASLLRDASNLQLDNPFAQSPAMEENSHGGMLVWMDDEKNLQVRALSPADDSQLISPAYPHSDLDRPEEISIQRPSTEATLRSNTGHSLLNESRLKTHSGFSPISASSQPEHKRGWPPIQYRVNTPSSSIVIGETYRFIEPSINDIIPVKVLDQKDEALWLGVRSDMPDAYVEIRWERS